MIIKHEDGNMVEAKVGMKVWINEVHGIALTGFVDEVVAFVEDVFGDECMLMSCGAVCGPQEVVAKWQM